MDGGGALRDDPGPDPGWGDTRQQVIRAAEACACAAAMSLRGGGRGPAAVTFGQAVTVLRDLAEVLRSLAFDEAAVEAEARRRAAELVTAAGLAPPPARRHLRAV